MEIISVRSLCLKLKPLHCPFMSRFMPPMKFFAKGGGRGRVSSASGRMPWIWGGFFFLRIRTYSIWP